MVETYRSSPTSDQIIWTLRAAARRERFLDEDSRRLLDPRRSHWKAFAGGLNDGDLVRLVVEDTAARNPLALRPLDAAVDAAEGSELLDRALREDTGLLRASSASFLEAAAVAFGRQALDPERRSAFEAIRAQDQRILELPSTAGRVTSAVAPAGAPLETYVAYIVADRVDRFLIGLTMLEFDRNAAPLVIDVEDLRAGRVTGIGTFTRAATLGGEGAIVALLPAGAVARVIVL